MWGRRRPRRAVGSRGPSEGSASRGETPATPGTNEASAVGDELDAYLTGRSRQWFEDRGDPVPLWAYLNEAAHRDPEELCAISRGLDPPPLRGAVSGPGLALVIGALICEVAGGDPELVRLVQREVLLPLELDCFDQAVLGSASPARVAELARRRLVPYRHRGQRASHSG
jgi:hypothetical protein